MKPSLRMRAGFTADHGEHPQGRPVRRKDTGTSGADRSGTVESDPAPQFAAQADLMVIRARTMLVNAARGLTKSYGERLGSCGTGQIREGLAESLSEPLQNALQPLLAEVESISERIREYDERIENIGKNRYPETELLKQVHGLGTLTALTYVLTVDDPYRFRRRSIRTFACPQGQQNGSGMRRG